MKAHPAKGAAIMEAIPQLADIIPGMKHHHEKWEGGGYPDGLMGEADPAPGADRRRRRHVRRHDDDAPLSEGDGDHLRAGPSAGAGPQALPRGRRRGPRQVPRQGRADSERRVRRGGAKAAIGGAVRAARRIGVALAISRADVASRRAGPERRRRRPRSPEQRMAPAPPARRPSVDAEKAFREALKYDPKNPEVLDGLGASLVMQGRYQEALPSLQKAVELDPQNGSRTATIWASPRWSSDDFEEAALAFAAAEASPISDDRISARDQPRPSAAAPGRPPRRRSGVHAGDVSRPQSVRGAVRPRRGARESRGQLEGAAEDYLAASEAPAVERGSQPAAGPVPGLAPEDGPLAAATCSARSSSTRTAKPGAKARMLDRAVEVLLSLRQTPARARRRADPAGSGYFPRFPMSDEPVPAERPGRRGFFPKVRRGSLHDAYRDPREARDAVKKGLGIDESLLDTLEEALL